MYVHSIRRIVGFNNNVFVSFNGPCCIEGMAEKENCDDAPAPRAPEIRGKCLSLKWSRKMNPVDAIRRQRNLMKGFLLTLPLTISLLFKRESVQRILPEVRNGLLGISSCGE